MRLIPVGDIVEANGKTWRENNLAIPHNIPLGAIVETDFECGGAWGVSFKGTGTFYVVLHHRDCDGTPLYGLSEIPVGYPAGSAFGEEWRAYKVMSRLTLLGYPEGSLRATGQVAEKFYKDFYEFSEHLRGA